MANASAASTDRHSQVHTEVRAPVEVVVSRVTMFVFGVIEVFIGIRFVLMLLGANAEAGFAKLIYTGDKGLQREGKIDQGTAAAMRKVDEAADKIKDVVNPKR